MSKLQKLETAILTKEAILHELHHHFSQKLFMWQYAFDDNKPTRKI